GAVDARVLLLGCRARRAHVTPAPLAPHCRRFGVSSGKGASFPLRGRLILDDHDLAPVSGGQCLEDGGSARRSVGRLVRDGADTPVAHAEVGSRGVERPDGVEGTVVVHLAGRVDRRVGTLPVDARAVYLPVAPDRRDAVLDAAGGVPPPPLAV